MSAPGSVAVTFDAETLRRAWAELSEHLDAGDLRGEGEVDIAECLDVIAERLDEVGA